VLTRRETLAAVVVVGLTGFSARLALAGASALKERVKPSEKPLWMGFGIGAGANEVPQRFQHITRLPQTLKDGSAPYLWVTQAIGSDLANRAGDLVNVDPNKNATKNSTQLAAVLDYENVVSFPQIGTNRQTDNFFYMRVAGQGMVLGFDDNGWRLLSSYPFYIKRLSTYSTDLKPAIEKAYPEVLIAQQNSFRSTFVDLTLKFNRWREGYSSYFAKVVKVDIRPEAATTFAKAGITDRFTVQSIGLAASASLCRGLAMPVVPFSETRALAEFTSRFADSPSIQKIRLPEGNDIDFRVEVVIISAEFKSWRNEQQGWHDVSRSMVIGVVFKDQNDAVILKCACYGQDKDISANEAAVVPERHLERFDLILTGVIDQLFYGMLNRDEAKLVAIGAQDVGAKVPLAKSPALALVLAKAERMRSIGSL
jgi:hypothetical protein